MDSCYQNRAAIFKALGDENRWKILDILKGGEKCACVLLNKLEISQPTLSHHMKILCDARLVNGRKEGKWTYYSFNPEGIERAKELLNQITTVTDSIPRSCNE